MGQRINKREGPENPKRIKPGGESLSGYDSILSIYSALHQAYHWTRTQIDTEEAEYLLDLIRVQMAETEPGEKLATIDEVL